MGKVREYIKCDSIDNLYKYMERQPENDSEEAKQDYIARTDAINNIRKYGTINVKPNAKRRPTNRLTFKILNMIMNVCHLRLQDLCEILEIRFEYPLPEAPRVIARLETLNSSQLTNLLRLSKSMCSNKWFQPDIKDKCPTQKTIYYASQLYTFDDFAKDNWPQSFLDAWRFKPIKLTHGAAIDFQDFFQISNISNVSLHWLFGFPNNSFGYSFIPNVDAIFTNYCFMSEYNRRIFENILVEMRQVKTNN